MAIMGHQIGQELCDALGLPKHTRSFTLRCAVDEVVTVECEYYPEGGSFVTVMAKYELARKESQPTANFDAWMAKRQQKAHDEMMARIVWLRPQ